MNKKLRGCLLVLGGTLGVLFLLLVVAGVLAVRSGNRADANAKALCAAIPVGSTVASAQATARRHPTPPKEYVHDGGLRFAYYGALMHQAECNLEVSDGVVTKKSFRVEDY